MLGLGELGAFDDNGVTPTWVLNRGKRKYLYYVGWNKGVTVRMHLYVGLAISEDGGKSFKRYSRAPILERVREVELGRSARRGEAASRLIHVVSTPEEAADLFAGALVNVDQTRAPARQVPASERQEG